MADVIVTAVSDPWEDSPAGVVNEPEPAGIARPTVFVDHRDLLNSGLCDAAVVASSNMNQAAVIHDGLETGLHVLAEKPM